MKAPMTQRFTRWSIDIGLWLALAGLVISVLLHIVAFFSAGWWEKVRLVFAMHLGLMGLVGFTAVMYKVRGELYGGVSFPPRLQRLYWCCSRTFF